MALTENNTEALQAVLERHHAERRKAAQQVIPAPTPPSSAVPIPVPGTQAEKQRGAKREQRQTRYEEVARLHEQGVPMQAIARQLKLGRNTVRRWLRAGQAPEHRHAARRSTLDRHAEYLTRRWAEGCRKASSLYRELQQQGYRGCEARVRQWVARHLKADLPAHLQHGAKRATTSTERFPTPLARTTAWLLLRKPEDLPENEQRYTKCLTENSHDVQRAQQLADRFSRMVKQRRVEGLAPWLEEAAASELRGFADGIRRDQAAVAAALSLPWSNGQTEGQVQRLKLLKRQRHGRAKLDLLKQRMLCGA